MNTFARLLLVAFLVVLATSTSVALGEDQPAPRTTAQLDEDGRKHFRAHDYATAYAEFNEAANRSDADRMLQHFQAGNCAFELGQFEVAQNHYRQAQDFADAKRDRVPLAWIEVAITRLAQVEEKVKAKDAIAAMQTFVIQNKQETIEKLDKIIADNDQNDQRQEKLIADLRARIAVLDAKVKGLEAQVAEMAKTIVDLQMTIAGLLQMYVDPESGKPVIREEAPE